MDANALVKAALAGDQRAWTKLYRRVAPELHKYFARRLPASEVDDLVHTTLMAVLAKLHLFEGLSDSAFMRFVYGFARNEIQSAMRSWRRRDARHAAFEREQALPRTSLGSKIQRAQHQAILRYALTKLNEYQQRAIENDLEGDNAKVLADKLKVAPPAARMLQTRARRKLRKLVLEQIDSPRPRTPVPPTPKPERTPSPKQTPSARRTPSE